MSDETNPEDQYDVRREKLDEMREEGLDPYPRQYERTHTARQAHEAFNPDEDDRDRIRVAGRITGERLHGSAAFLDLTDETGSLQLYLSENYLDDEAVYGQFERYWDIGDHVGAEGELFETDEGELSIVVREAEVLSKGLRPLPEKFHGLKDRETRYRQRYLDLISNEDVRENFTKRSEFIAELRRNLEDRGFVEVETPMMQDLPGGAEAEPFVTHHNALDRDLFLRIAPELYLKRLLVGGFEQVFEINRNFRNEGISTRHNPEFTMLELYYAYVDYETIMELTERFLAEAVESVAGSRELPFDGETIDWSTPWRRATLRELVEDELGESLSLEDDPETILEVARDRGIDPEPMGTAGEQILEIFEEAVEDELVQPTFVTNFPSSVSPLAKDDPDSPGTSERFELFIGGLEVGNAYTELNDPIEQRENFEAQVDDGENIDEDFVEALEYGMPPAGGLGLGIDRLAMLLTDSASIREVILFPMLREQRG